MSTNEVKNREPFSFRNFQATTRRVQDYAHLVLAKGPNWLGCKYKCPIIWYPLDDYKAESELSEGGESIAI